MASILTVEVTAKGVAGEYLILRPATGGDPEIRLTFSDSRVGFGLVPIATDLISQANNFTNKFRGDYNTTEQFDIKREGSVITIENFTNGYFASFDDQSTSLTVSHADTPQELAFDTEETILKHGSTPCIHVDLKVDIVGGTNADVIQFRYNAGTLAESVTVTDVNTATFEVDRGRNCSYTVTINGVSREYQVRIPPVFFLERVDVATTVSGGTIDIVTTDQGLGFNDTEYQIQFIDGATPPPVEDSYQSSSIVTNVVPGDYIAYARDQFGCVRSKLFEVEEQDNYLRAPFYSFVSPVNDFPFVLRDGEQEGFNLNFNNLRAEEQPNKTGVTVIGEHFTYENQKGKIQFRSSGQINRAYMVSCSDTIELVVEQKSDFINKDTFLEGNYEYDADLDRLKVYFTTGNTYDIDGNITGTHNFNNTLPNYYEEGLLIIIPGVGQGVIESVDRTGAVDYAVTSLTNNLTATGVILQTIHTEVQYEEFEFEYDAADCPDDSFILRIDCAETLGEQQAGDLKSLGFNQWETHRITKLTNDQLCDFHLFEYFGYKRHEINYDYGIRHRRWVEWEYYPIPEIEGSIDTNQTDSQVDKIDYSGLRLFEVKTKPMANIIAVSLAEALGYAEFVAIDRKEFTTKEFPTLERLGVQRQFVVAKLIAQGRIVSFDKFDGVTSDVIESSGETSVANPFYPVRVD